MWVKICGIRDVDTALVAAQAGADAIGLNFYPGSKRRVDVDEAARIVEALPADVTPIGLFVNADVTEIVRIARECGLHTLQLHGDEPAELLAELAYAGRFELIRAFRVGAAGLAPMEAELARLQQAGVTLAGCLVDADVQGHYGGTGQTAPWDLLSREWRAAEWPPLILAGGLTPSNVAEAIRSCRPWGVDVAGGVESAPGRKEPSLIQEFLQNARDAS